MKYLKTYESYGFTPELWRLKTKTPFFKVGMDKIGITDEELENFLDENRAIENFYLDKEDYILILIDYNENGDKEILWSDNRNDFTYNRIRDPEYMGDVEITDEDIENWNIKQDAKKYNL